MSGRMHDPAQRHAACNPAAAAPTPGRLERIAGTAAAAAAAVARSAHEKALRKIVFIAIEECPDVPNADTDRVQQQLQDIAETAAAAAVSQNSHREALKRILDVALRRAADGDTAPAAATPPAARAAAGPGPGHRGAAPPPTQGLREGGSGAGAERHGSGDGHRGVGAGPARAAQTAVIDLISDDETVEVPLLTPLPQAARPPAGVRAEPAAAGGRSRCPLCEGEFPEPYFLDGAGRRRKLCMLGCHGFGRRVKESGRKGDDDDLRALLLQRSEDLDGQVYSKKARSRWGVEVTFSLPPGEGSVKARLTALRQAQGPAPPLPEKGAVKPRHGADNQRGLRKRGRVSYEEEDTEDSERSEDEAEEDDGDDGRTKQCALCERHLPLTQFKNTTYCSAGCSRYSSWGKKHGGTLTVRRLLHSPLTQFAAETKREPSRIERHFGLRHSVDGAASIVERLRKEFPQCYARRITNAPARCRERAAAQDGGASAGVQPADPALRAGALEGQALNDRGLDRAGAHVAPRPEAAASRAAGIPGGRSAFAVGPDLAPDHPAAAAPPQKGPTLPPRGAGLGATWPTWQGGADVHQTAQPHDGGPLPWGPTHPSKATAHAAIDPQAGCHGASDGAVATLLRAMMGVKEEC